MDFESTGFSAGRMVKKNGAVGPEYHVNDYLCSVRVVTDYMGRVLERNDYSGFGKRLDSSTGSTNRYRFSGKEEQGFAGLPWQDFGARMYDPDLARWTTQDPLADQYHGISPYAFCNNNPVNFVDPDGRKLYFANDVSEKFKQQFAEVVKFMNAKGTAGDLAKLEASSEIFYIDDADEQGKSRFSPKEMTIYWDANSIIETTDNIYISPATILSHEANHAAEYNRVMQNDSNSERSKLNKAKEPNSDREYDNKEERRVITGIEQEAARKHGEIRQDQVTRKNHKYRDVITVQDGISPEALSNKLFEHNNLF